MKEGSFSYSSAQESDVRVASKAEHSVQIQTCISVYKILLYSIHKIRACICV